MRFDPRFTRSSHLVEVIAEAERLAGRLVASDPGPRAALAERRLVESAVATLRLDGSPIDEQLAARLLTAMGPPQRRAPVTPSVPPVPSRGGWHHTLRVSPERLEEAPDDEILATELAGAMAGLSSDDLAAELLDRPVDVLARLHGRITRGLVDPDVAGRPRTTTQAVHDASVGRVIYFAPPPTDAVAGLHVLGGWLTGAAAREHAVVVSGVLLLELLRLHPYEAANGRHARAAARLALRARGLDPDGLAAPEPWLALDPLGLYEEVARTGRRRDLTIWLERWGEAVAAGLRTSARRLDVLSGDPPPRAVAFALERRGSPFTVADYRAVTRTGPEEATLDLHALLDEGLIRRIPGARGLRFDALEPDALT